MSFLRDHVTTYACGTNCRSGQDFLSRESIFRARLCRIPVQCVHNAWPIRVRVMIFLVIELAVERRYPRVLRAFRPLADNFSTRRVLLLSLSIPLLWAAAAVSDLGISRCAFLIHFPCTIPREGLRSLIFGNLEHFVGAWRIAIRWNLLIEDVYNFEEVPWDILDFRRMLPHETCDNRLRKRPFRMDLASVHFSAERF